jgi:ubiquinone biosynthesis protein UbiJ
LSDLNEDLIGQIEIAQASDPIPIPTLSGRVNEMGPVELAHESIDRLRSTLRRHADAVSPLFDTLSRSVSEMNHALQHTIIDNQRLRADLAALDEDFFDEIEDLKYRLSRYEARFGQLHED